jgi:hypothetical protein
MSETQRNYVVKLRSPSRDQVVDIVELSTPAPYADLISVNAAAQQYVDAKNTASAEPQDWYAVATCTDEPSV